MSTSKRRENMHKYEAARDFVVKVTGFKSTIIRAHTKWHAETLAYGKHCLQEPDRKKYSCIGVANVKHSLMIKFKTNG